MLVAGEIQAPPLPFSVQTRSGLTLHPADMIWHYRDSGVDVNLNFASFKGVEQRFCDCLKGVLIWYVENRSPGHLINMFSRMRHFCAFVLGRAEETITSISVSDIINYHSHLENATAWYLGALAGLLRRWTELEIPGISIEVIRLLDQLTLPGNTKGAAVLTMDPCKGPLTDVELSGVCVALSDAYAAKAISLRTYVLVWLSLLLAQRPKQYASMKAGDLSVEKSEDGSSSYWIKVPRAKQRNQLSRAEFKERPLTPQIGRIVAEYIAQVKAQFNGLLTDTSQAPLFPDMAYDNEVAPGFEFHSSSGVITRTITKTIDSLVVYSERTGKPIRINPRRFRYTKGTNAAREGYSQLVIAEILDHSDTQNVSIYVKNSPEVINRVDAAIAVAMAPLARAFAGELIFEESEAVRAGDPKSLILNSDGTSNFEPMGNCGTFSECSFAVPIGCYTCRNFQPWLDGPHQTVLDQLLAERDRLLSTGDERIATVNDRTILAVAEVVRQCNSINEGVNSNGQ